MPRSWGWGVGGKGPSRVTNLSRYAVATCNRVDTEAHTAAEGPLRTLALSEAAGIHSCSAQDVDVPSELDKNISVSFTWSVPRYDYQPG